MRRSRRFSGLIKAVLLLPFKQVARPLFRLHLGELRVLRAEFLDAVPARSCAGGEALRILQGGKAALDRLFRATALPPPAPSFPCGNIGGLLAARPVITAVKRRAQRSA